MCLLKFGKKKVQVRGLASRNGLWLCHHTKKEEPLRWELMKTLAVLPAKDRSKKLHNQNLLPESAIRRLFSPHFVSLLCFCVSWFLHWRHLNLETGGGRVSLNYKTTNFESNKNSGPFAKFLAGAQARTRCQAVNSSVAHGESDLTQEARPRPLCGSLQHLQAIGWLLSPLISLQNLRTFLPPINTSIQLKASVEQMYPFNFTSLILDQEELHMKNRED